MKALLFSLLLGSPALPQEMTPDFTTSWMGYDTSTADAGRWPWAFQAGDLDGDGDLDYAVVSGASIPKLSILLNAGNGVFAQPQMYKPAPGTFWDDVQDLALGDFDQDGDLDVAVTRTGNYGTSTGIAVHRNQGDGTLAPFVTYAGGTGSTGIVAADLDGDGWVDLATADYGDAGMGKTVSVLRNDHQGGFLSPVGIAVDASPYRLVPGDFDGDGRQDLAVAHDAHKLTLLLNTGAGFAKSVYPVFPSAYAGSIYPAVEAGDLDRDGDLDLVYSNLKTGFDPDTGTGAVALLYNDGSGLFGAPVGLATTPETQGALDLALADWTGDGWLDVASAHGYDGEWHLFRSNGSGGFGPAEKQAATSESREIDGADVTGDGRPDLLVLGRWSLELAVYKNPGGGDFAGNPVYPFVSSSPLVGSGVSAADVDGDGDLDMGTAWGGVTSTSGGQSVLRNLGQGVFSAPKTYPSPVKAKRFLFRELDGDGYPDMLWLDDYPPYRAHSRMNLKDGNFGAQKDWSMSGCTLGDVEALDIDGDLDLDLVVSNDCSQHALYLRKNDGSGEFGPISVHGISSTCSAIASGDVDADGKVDLVTNSGYQGIEVSLGNGDGTFQPPFQSVTEWAPTSLVVVDLDGDQILDVAASCAGSGDHPTVSVLIGYGDGGFKPKKDYLGSHDPYMSNAGRICALDADGDGDIDLSVSNYTSLDVSFHRNRGDGTFEPQVRYGTGEEAYGMTTGDFDGDLIEDLAVGIVPGWSLGFYPALTILPGTLGTSWKVLGFGLAGAHGVPALDVGGDLVPGAGITLELSNALAGTVGAHVAGFEPWMLPFQGGVLVPALGVVIPTVTDASGASTTAVVWPSSVPFGFELWLQTWVLDPAGPQGFAASAALHATQY